MGKRNIKSVLKYIILVIFIIILFATIGHIKKEEKIKMPQSLEGINIPDITEETQISKKSEFVKEKLIEEEYYGYKVEALLEIPQIDLKTNVLAEYSKQGLAKCASKFWGRKCK